MKNLKEIVNTKDVDGKDITLAVLHPTYDLLHKRQLEHNRAFREAIESGAILREALDKFMRDQNLWDDSKQKEYEDLNKKLADGENALAAGGIKLSEARRLAVQMRLYRLQLRSLLSERLNLDTYTAQGQAENHAFNWMLVKCVVNDSNGEQYFKSLSDYTERIREEAASDCATVFASMTYGLPKDYQKELPENQFLVKYKLVDEQLRLINSDNQLVDIDNKRIDEVGNYLDGNGNIMDINGKPMDKNGNPIVEFKPFLDENEKPIQDTLGT
jgi:hypothetical protein